METRLMPTCIIGFFFCLSSLASHAQHAYLPGYIIKKNGDTTRVFLLEESSERMLLHVRWKGSASENEPSQYGPGDILGFGYNNGSVYRSITFLGQATDSPRSKTYFAEQLVAGHYDLYMYIENEEPYYVVQDDTHSYLLYNSTYFPNGEEKVKGNYLQELTFLAVVCDKPVKHIAETKYNDKDIVALIIGLNRCADPGGSNTNYYHPPKSKTEVVIFAGGLPLAASGQITAEAMVRRYTPKINETVSLNFGVHYSSTVIVTSSLNYGNVRFETSTKNVILCVPVTVQYNFSEGLIQPYISFGAAPGYNVRSTSMPPGPGNGIPTTSNRFIVGLVAEIGVEGYITQHFLIKAAWRYELQLQYPAIGIAYIFK